MTDKFQDTRRKADLFSYLLVISLLLVTGFYWPNHDIVFMKILAMQTAIIILCAYYFMFGGARKINDIFPGLMLIYFVINALTHKLQGNTESSLAMCLYIVLGMYCFMNSLSEKHIPMIKKTIVIFGVLNVLSYFLEKSGLQAPFIDVGVYNSNRASGFMIYPAHFALLCAVSAVFAYEWKKWLCVPLAIGLIAVNELSVNIGFFICVAFHFRELFKNNFFTFLVLTSGIIAFILFGKHIEAYLYDKSSVRLTYWRPSLEQCFTRLLDGSGFGSYEYISNKLVPNMPVNYLTYLHNEPLQAFLEGGVAFISLLGFWFLDLKKKIFNLKIQEAYVCCFILFLCTSLGHSILHFCDCLWLLIIIYTLFHVEYHETNLRFKLEEDDGEVN